MSVQSRAAQVHPPSERIHRAKAIAAITIGNGLEFFDFTVYSFFATLIARQYFPTDDPFVELLVAVGTFGVGFIMRPIGALVLGAYADRVGRKAGMSMTLWLMTAGSAIIVATPTYASIGIAAPVLIIAARLLQGFALGGEVGTSTSLLMEYATASTRGFYGSWQMVSQGINTVCGSLLGVLLVSNLSAASLGSWGWRVPFMIGMLMGPTAMFIRRHLEETLASPGVEVPIARHPVHRIFTAHRRMLVAGIVTMAGATVPSYVVLLYLSTYAAQILHLPMSSALWSSWVAAMTSAICAPFAGLLSDRIGRIRVIAGSRILLIVAAYPAFALLNGTPTIGVLLIVSAALAVLVAFTVTPNIVLLSALFPADVRATSVSIVYSLAVAIFGGFSQFFATALLRLTGSNLAPGWYLMGCAAVSLIPLVFIRETAVAPAADSSATASYPLTSPDSPYAG